MKCTHTNKQNITQDEDEEQSVMKSEKIAKAKKQPAYNPFEDLQGGNDGEGESTQGDGGYNPFADFMDGVRCAYV